VEKMSTKPFLRNRFVDEFNRFTTFIFGNTRFSTNRDTRFEAAAAEAIGDYTEARVQPIEIKNTEQDGRLTNHDTRINNHETRIRQLETAITRLQAQLNSMTSR
jgi:hypothetical protein